jgi:hypothetical protein
VLRWSRACLIFQTGFNPNVCNREAAMTSSADSNSICPKCGGALEVRRDASTQGLFCTKCDWSAVTTYLPEILRDTTTYEVMVKSGDFKNGRHLKAISQIADVNLLAARKLLQGPGDFVVFTGLAHKVKSVRDLLAAAGLEFETRPSFPW